jgi:Ras-related protein Rab-1A
MLQRIELDGHSANLALTQKRLEEKNHCPWLKTRNSFTACLLVYDVSNPESFNNLWGWLVEIDKYVPNCTKFLLGNKSDLLSKVPFKRATEFAKQAGMIPKIDFPNSK